MEMLIGISQQNQEKREKKKQLDRDQHLQKSQEGGGILLSISQF